MNSSRRAAYDEWQIRSNFDSQSCWTMGLWIDGLWMARVGQSREGGRELQVAIIMKGFEADMEASRVVPSLL